MTMKKAYYKGEQWHAYSSDAIIADNRVHDGDKLTILDTGEKFIWDNGAWGEDLEMYYAVKKALEDS